MTLRSALDRLELQALLAVARLGDDAYGVTVCTDICTTTSRDVSVAAVYAALDRLEGDGLVRAWQSEPRPERGGRTRRYFALTAVGHAALRNERALLTKMWRGVSLTKGSDR